MSARSFLRKLAIAVGSLVVLACLAELAARCAEPGPMSLYDVSPYVRDPKLPHVHIKNFRGAWDGTYYEINSRGWRGPEYEPKFDASEYRVVALGDSATFGKGVEERDCWPRQLERDLQAELGDSRKALVANLGVNGYAGKDYFEVFLTQALPLKPQLVVIAYSLNDFPNVLQKVDAQVFQNKTNLRSKIPYDLRNQLGTLASFRWLRATLYEFNRDADLQAVEKQATQAGAGDGGSPERMKQESERLQRIVHECDAIRAHLVVFLLPYESQVYLASYSRAPIESLHSAVEPLGIAYLDVVEPFRSAARKTDPLARLFIRGDRYHPNAAGYGIVAQAVAGVVRAQRWLTAEH